MARSSINQLNEAYAEEIKAGCRRHPAGRACKVFFKIKPKGVDFSLEVKTPPFIWFDEAKAFNNSITKRVKWTLSELDRIAIKKPNEKILILNEWSLQNAKS